MYPLSREDYKKLDSAVVDLYSLQDRLDEVVHPDLLDKLEESIEKIRAVLKPIHQIEDFEDEKRYKIWEEFENNFSENTFSTFWCLKEKNPNDFAVFDDLKDFPLAQGTTEDNTKFVIEYQGINEILVPGFTWGELRYICNSLIEKSGDEHHVFIEGFEVIRIEHSKKEYTVFVQLLTGS